MPTKTSKGVRSNALYKDVTSGILSASRVPLYRALCVLPGYCGEALPFMLTTGVLTLCCCIELQQFYNSSRSTKSITNSAGVASNAKVAIDPRKSFGCTSCADPTVVLLRGV